MKEKTKPLMKRLIWSALFLLVILLMQPLEVVVFMKKIPVLFPEGMIAFKERNLLFFIQALMLLVIVPVYIFTFIFSWWYRADNERSTYDPHLVDHKVAEVIWWGVPIVMLSIVAVITWYKTYELDPYRPLTSEKKPLTIEAVALDWKWLFIYPEEEIATVNILHIPKDRPLHFLITADAPMNTLWIPRLGGMVYAMPGMQTQLHLISEAEGTFRGSSAHVSGKGFSKMHFPTISTTEKLFDEWVASVKQSEKELTMESYNELAKPTIGHPEELYRLSEKNLYKKIIMKYMHPQKHED